MKTKTTTSKNSSHASKNPTKKGVTKLAKFSSGAVRSIDVAGGNGDQSPRYDLVCPSALRRLAITMGEGAEKYGPHNWTLGIPNSNSLNHALAHLQEYLAGDRSEDHLAHAMANIQFIIHFNHGCTCAEGHKLLEATNAE